MKAILILIILSSYGCLEQHDTIPRSEACTEQASAWCTAAGFASEGCTDNYLQWCQADVPAHVRVDAQLRCLDDIANDSNPDTIPRSCERSWAIVPTECTSHCEE